MVKGVHNALSLVLALSRAFGAFVLRAQGRTYVFSYKLISYFIVLAMGTIAEGIIEASNLQSECSFSLLLIVDIFVFCFYLITAIIVLYQHYRLREPLPAIISELEDMEDHIGDVSYGRYYSYGVIFLSILNALPRIFAVLRRSFAWNYLLTRILYYSFTQIPLLIAAQYAMFLHILSRQLYTLSEQLNTAIFNLEVWRLIDIHHNLVLLADRINRAFDLFLIHMVTFIFVINILRLYFLIVYIVNPVSYTDLELTIISFVDILINCGSLIIIVSAAMEATKKAELFNKQLLKSLLISKTIAQDEKIRTYLGMKHSIQQSACNFFSLDYHLLTSMAAGTTTYVILLVQFTLL
ncbi:putative gustatory receptor 39b isoform X3 [Halyomorpha halys]|uniref:putative gustatory receptor 39b isoform X3 n=1 Tax=Halyomorpha halys TaxID=286706 RepID=UPI0034D24B01|nr:Gustatory receptor 159a [Halyomorpha halys]